MRCIQTRTCLGYKLQKARRETPAVVALLSAGR